MSGYDYYFVLFSLWLHLNFWTNSTLKFTRGKNGYDMKTMILYASHVHIGVSWKLSNIISKVVYINIQTTTAHKSDVCEQKWTFSESMRELLNKLLL